MTTVTESKIPPVMFLPIFTAYLPPGRYSVDVGKWCNVIKILRDRHEDEYPELFWGFEFSERPPAFPYSSQVDRWLTTLYVAVGAPNGPIRIQAEGKVWLEFPPSFQERQRVWSFKHARMTTEVALTIKKFAEEAAKEGLLAP